jgi:putative serine protease PepD
MATTRHDQSWGRWLPWAIVGGALVVGIAVGGGIAGGIASGAAEPTACDATSVANQVMPAVVTLGVRSPGGSGTGSGEVLQSDGYILTNNHVIASAAGGGSIEVQFADGQKLPATITGRDPQTDIAVVKVSPPNPLPAIPLGTSSSVQVGQPVVVLGSPLGLAGSVTSGIVSALDRTVQVPAENNTSALLVSAVQTDAAINPGNSGGSMVNCDGQLIGVPSAGATVPTSSGESSGGSIGIGFAIPVDLANSVANEIIATGRVTHSYFGLAVLPVPPAVASKAGIPSGLSVQAAVPGGPAAQAGLQAGDVITSLDGEQVTSTVQLEELTLTKQPGETVSVGYTRDGNQATATVTLGAQP